MREVAEELAKAHLEEDPDTTEIYLSDAVDEIRLVEISRSVGDAAQKEVLPFRFGENPKQGVDYPSVVILLSPAEWESVRRGEMSLPHGWNKNDLTRLL